MPLYLPNPVLKLLTQSTRDLDSLSSPMEKCQIPCSQNALASKLCARAGQLFSLPFEAIHFHNKLK